MLIKAEALTIVNVGATSAMRKRQVSQIRPESKAISKAGRFAWEHGRA